MILIVDQLSKLWILQLLPNGSYFLDSVNKPIVVIPHFFYIVHIKNPGAAWGILAGFTVWLAALGFIALVLLFVFRKELQLHRNIMQYAFGLLTGGIIGNMIDRIAYGSVIDFLDFHFGTYRYPAFNVADCGITIGVAIYIIACFWPEKGKVTNNAE